MFKNFKLTRILIGMVLIALVLFGKIGDWGWLCILPLLSGLMGMCPSCQTSGTCPTK